MREPVTTQPDRLPDLICFSHLRWSFVFQRPQHLMVRAARDRRVYFVEERAVSDEGMWLDTSVDQGVTVVVPHLARGIAPSTADALLTQMLREFFDRRVSPRPVAWVYTPMMVPLLRELRPSTVVYDCMDELSGFVGAPVEMPVREEELLQTADVVFTGGHSLYEAKRKHHSNVHAFPSSVDVSHFARAREILEAPEDQRVIPRPRIGFCGVIDERMDIPLLRAVAALKPDWHFVLIGPTAKIDPATLPHGANLHYLGVKPYAQLPAYFAGWSAATLPFARNMATRFISPTKTPEYLAAGCPVVSTSIADVVQPYGELRLAEIADTPDAFVRGLERAMGAHGRHAVARAKSLLDHMSWDRTWAEMSHLVRAAEAAPDESQAFDQTARSSTHPVTVTY
jgi:glycosyltransferase involved in cell wall biosynthesis